MSEVKINPLYSTFNFVGTLNLFKDKGKFYSSNADDATAEYLNSRVNFAIKTSDTNMIFVELSGGYKRLSPQDIKTMDKDKNKMEVKWSDRKNPEILKDVANWRAVRINLQDSSLDDCQKFLCSIGSSCYDAVEYLKTTLQDGTRVYISGNKEYSRYKNKEGQWRIGIKYIPNIIRLAKDDEEDKAEGVESFIFDKDSWDEGVLKTEKKVYINGYTTCYDRTIGEKGETIFIPVMYTLNCEALDFENEQHTRIFNYFKDCFKASKKEYKATQWHCYIKRGFNMQEITMDDLNEDQKIQIQIGLKTLDEIAKEMRNGTISEKIDEVQLYAPTNGMKDNTVSELTQYVEEDFFIPESAPKEEKLTDVQEKTEDDKTSTVSETYKSLFPMK